MAAKGEAKLLYPGLGDFYGTWRDISYTLIRVVVGVIMIMHVWGKFKAGPAAVAATMAKNGLEYEALVSVAKARIQIFQSALGVG